MDLPFDTNKPSTKNLKSILTASSYKNGEKKRKISWGGTRILMYNKHGNLESPPINEIIRGIKKDS